MILNVRVEALTEPLAACRKLSMHTADLEGVTTDFPEILQPPLTRHVAAPFPTNLINEVNATVFFLAIVLPAGATVVAGDATVVDELLEDDEEVVVDSEAATVPTFMTGAEYEICGNTTFTPKSVMVKVGVTVVS